MACRSMPYPFSSQTVAIKFGKQGGRQAGKEKNGKEAPSAFDERMCWLAGGLAVCVCVCWYFNLISSLKIEIVRKPGLTGWLSFHDSLGPFVGVVFHSEEKTPSLILVPFIHRGASLGLTAKLDNEWLMVGYSIVPFPSLTHSLTSLLALACSSERERRIGFEIWHLSSLFNSLWIARQSCGILDRDDDD